MQLGFFYRELKFANEKNTLSASDIFSRVKEYLGDASSTSQIWTFSVLVMTDMLSSLISCLIVFL